MWLKVCSKKKKNKLNPVMERKTAKRWFSERSSQIKQKRKPGEEQIEKSHAKRRDWSGPSSQAWAGVTEWSCAFISHPQMHGRLPVVLLLSNFFHYLIQIFYASLSKFLLIVTNNPERYLKVKNYKCRLIITEKENSRHLLSYYIWQKQIQGNNLPTL